MYGAPQYRTHYHVSKYNRLDEHDETVHGPNAPRFRPNPNTGVPLAQEDGRMLVAKNVVHHSTRSPSALYLPIVSLSQLPEHNILDDVNSMLDDAAAEAHMDRATLKAAIERFAPM